MSAFGMQVACDCKEGNPQPMMMIETWDGEVNAGWDEGRRYVWECQTCTRRVCINMKFIEIEEEE
jgi:hypothetical protein